MASKPIRPFVGALYKHFKGVVYVVRGFAHTEKDDEEVVIYSDTNTCKVYTRPLNDFFAKHPKTGVPRFQLVQVRD